MLTVISWLAGHEEMATCLESFRIRVSKGSDVIGYPCPAIFSWLREEYHPTAWDRSRRGRARVLLLARPGSRRRPLRADVALSRSPFGHLAIRPYPALRL